VPDEAAEVHRLAALGALESVCNAEDDAASVVTRGRIVRVAGPSSCPIGMDRQSAEVLLKAKPPVELVAIITLRTVVIERNEQAHMPCEAELRNHRHGTI